MSDTTNVAKSLRERLSGGTEDRLGKALGELLENPLLHGAIGRAFDAREKAAQAQEIAMGALNLPSAADIERLTRRLRSVSHRLEGIEDGVDRLDRTLSPGGVEERLSAIEAQLRTLMGRLERPELPATPAPTGPATSRKGAPSSKRKAAPASNAAPASKRKAAPASRAAPARKRKAAPARKRKAAPARKRKAAPTTPGS
jgi:hypothetical protein